MKTLSDYSAKTWFRFLFFSVFGVFAFFINFHLPEYQFTIGAWQWGKVAAQSNVLVSHFTNFLKAALYFCSYHPVDSSDMAFQTAAGIAYKEGLPTAGPTLLEPIGELKVLIPDSNMGDVIGDLNKRRGRVMGMNPDPENPGYQIVEAEVPVGEMTSYSIDLRAMSQGRGSYTLKFVRYEEVPQMNQAKIIEDAKKEEEEA